MAQRIYIARQVASITSCTDNRNSPQATKSIDEIQHGYDLPAASTD
jgi:hypothetical protein